MKILSSLILSIILIVLWSCSDAGNDPVSPVNDNDCAGVEGGTAEILTYWYDADSDSLGAGDSSQFCNALVEEVENSSPNHVSKSTGEAIYITQAQRGVNNFVCMYVCTVI